MRPSGPRAGQRPALLASVPSGRVGFWLQPELSCRRGVQGGQAQRHVSPAEPRHSDMFIPADAATATCPHPADSATATCLPPQTPPQRHVHPRRRRYSDMFTPADHATATCPHPAGSATATCSPRRRRYSDMSTPADHATATCPHPQTPLQRHVHLRRPRHSDMSTHSRLRYSDMFGTADLDIRRDSIVTATGLPGFHHGLFRSGSRPS